MLATVICVCGFLVLGGITKLCLADKRYSEEYYKYLRDNKKVPARHPDANYYRYL